MKPVPPSDETTADEALRRWAGGVLAKGTSDTEPPADPTAVSRFARAHGIGLCLIDRSFGQAPWRRLLQEDADWRNAVAVEMVRTQEFLSVLDSLHRQASLRPVVFKGQALAHTLYRHPCLRPHGDIDILVDPTQRTEVCLAMERLGYRRAMGIDGHLITKQFALHKTRSGLTHIWDVHWDVSSRPALADILSYERMRGEAVRSLFDDVAVLTPNQVHNLLIGCLHLIGHHSNDIRMIWLYDIHLLVHSLSEKQRRAFVEEARRRLEVQACCHAALLMTAKYLPSETTTALVSVLDPGPGARLDKHKSYMGRLLDDARAVRNGGRLRFVAQHMFPSSNYMMKRFGLRYRWQVPLWYLLRIGRALPKLLRR